ncbi:MAG TPA: hypothetical protein VFT38_11635 [Vicinamibacteria bacterium]|nr:hypothetical protein [Vicinamibacteria bacterium]
MNGRWATAFLGLLFAGAAGAPGPAPRQDAWTIVGPGGGGTMRRPAISPRDARLVALGCDMTGAYLTRDAGESWRMFHLGGVVESFAFDPSDASVLYAANGALWRSMDAGRTWSMVFPDPAKNTVEHGWGDHADTVFTSDDPFYPSGQDASIQSVVVDPADGRHLVLAMSATAPGPPGSHPSSRTAVLASKDRGRTWTREGELGVERVFALWAEPGLVRAIGETGAYEADAAGWHRFDPPAGQKIQSGSFGRDPGTKRTLLYVTTPAGIAVSEDGGRAWRDASGTLGALQRGAGDAAWGPAKGSKPSLGPIAASANHGLVAYVGLRGVRRAEGEPPFNGIAKTTDGGRTWAVVHAEPDRPSSNLEGSWIEERALEDGHSVWFDAPYDLAVAPGDPDVCFATDLFRTYRTRDGGRTWAQVNSVRRGPDQWTSRGLDVTSSYGVHWDPFDQRRVFITYTDIGLFRSEDGGASWIGSSRGVPTRWRNTTYWVAFDPDVKGRMWGAFSGTHDLPRPKMWRRTDPDRFQGGVGVSSDGGRTWTPSNTGMPESAITHVLLDPASRAGARTLYATAYGRGVFKSTDDGRTWTLKNDGLEPHQPFAWRLTRAQDGTLYVVVARRSERGRIGDADDGALYRSTDGAEHWTRMALPAGTNGPNGLAVDPADPRRLYLAAWGVATPGGDTGGGILLSTDAGTTWTNVLPQSQHVYDVTIDAKDPSVLYASGFDQAAYRSSDRGATWTRLRGFNFKWGHRVVPDLADPSKVYVTTFGGSVWHGPATGDPAAMEDVVPAALPRLEQLVEANIRGVQAYQVKLARAAGKGDPACWSTRLTGAAIDALVAHQAALLATDAATVKAWAEGRASTFDPARDLEPLLRSGLVLADTLPLSVYTAYLTAAAPGRPRAHIRAIANLYQTSLEVDRDGDVLQDLFRFDIGLGLPVYVGQLGLPGTDEDLLAVGRRLEGKSCVSPVGTTAAEWQIAGRKIWNWGEKNLHIRDARVVGDELLAEPVVAALVPKMRGLPAQRIAVIGHSFTMDLHWSSPSAFVPIVTAMFARENPKVEFRQFQGGGLTSTRAYNRFLQDVLAWKPDRLLLVVLNRNDEDLENFARLGKALTAAGARVYSFDDLHDPDASDAARLAREWAAGRASGITIVEVSRLLAAAPDRARFVCLDGIHMTEPWHRLMAKEWLELLVGAREPALEN